MVLTVAPDISYWRIFLNARTIRIWQRSTLKSPCMNEPLYFRLKLKSFFHTQRSPLPGSRYDGVGQISRTEFEHSPLRSFLSLRLRSENLERRHSCGS